MKTGLVLGKFAPLHNGHLVLIERALAEMDHVIVAVYDAPEATPIPIAVRSGWIKSRYPDIEILEAWNAPASEGNSPEIAQMHGNYIRELLGDRPLTRFYSSEAHGQHCSDALGAADRPVHEARAAVPLSGAALRENPFKNRHYFAPDVYQDLITKVVFLGAPSTGKTTLARALARRYGSTWMPEYSREYWKDSQRGRRLTLEDLVNIAEGHRIREDQMALNANGYLFVDTDATSTCQFSLYFHGEVRPRLAQWADQALDRYDLFFLCSDDIPYEPAWDHQGKSNRTEFQKQIHADLLQRKVPFITLTGSLKNRLNTVTKTLQNFEKFARLQTE